MIGRDMRRITARSSRRGTLRCSRCIGVSSTSCEPITVMKADSCSACEKVRLHILVHV